MIDDRVSIKGNGKNKLAMIVDWSIVDELQNSIRCKIIIKNDSLIVYAPVSRVNNIGFSTYYNTEVNKLYIGGDDVNDGVNIPLKVDINSNGCKIWKLGNV